MLAAYGSTYICEQTSLVTNFRKSKFCFRLTDEGLHATLRVSSSLKDDTHKFVRDTQPQKLHWRVRWKSVKTSLFTILGRMSFCNKGFEIIKIHNLKSVKKNVWMNRWTDMMKTIVIYRKFPDALNNLRKFLSAWLCVH